MLEFTLAQLIFTAKVETDKVTKRHVSTSGMLKYLGIFHSDYRAFLNHKPSTSPKCKKAVKSKIQEIYEPSKQNYSAPKFTKNLQKSGECIAERTFSKYMKVLPLIIHSNRGSHYVSQVYRDATDNVQRNYSRTSYPTTPL